MQVAETAVRCIECAHYRLKDAGPLCSMGFGVCGKSDETASFPSAVYPRQCEKYSKAPDRVIALRHRYLEWGG